MNPCSCQIDRAFDRHPIAYESILALGSPSLEYFFESSRFGQVWFSSGLSPTLVLSDLFSGCKPPCSAAHSKIASGSSEAFKVVKLDVFRVHPNGSP
jgi:hypothetical protein